VGDGMSSRLFMEVRERRALVYDIHSYLQRNLDCGIFGVYLGCEPKSAAEAVDVVMHELHRIPSEGVTEEELVRTKEYTKGRLLLGLEGTNSMCSFLGEQLLLAGEILSAQEIATQLDAVTSDQVVALARRLLAEKPVLAAVGAFPDSKLGQFAP
jgi:predicted Zn-dependent peptidase